jgi:hypothetical protein
LIRAVVGDCALSTANIAQTTRIGMAALHFVPSSIVGHAQTTDLTELDLWSLRTLCEIDYLRGGRAHDIMLLLFRPFFRFSERALEFSKVV